MSIRGSLWVSGRTRLWCSCPECRTPPRSPACSSICPWSRCCLFWPNRHSWRRRWRRRLPRCELPKRRRLCTPRQPRGPEVQAAPRRRRPRLRRSRGGCRGTSSRDPSHRPSLCPATPRPGCASTGCRGGTACRATSATSHTGCRTWQRWRSSAWSPKWRPGSPRRARRRPRSASCRCRHETRQRRGKPNSTRHPIWLNNPSLSFTLSHSIPWPTWALLDASAASDAGKHPQLCLNGGRQERIPNPYALSSPTPKPCPCIHLGSRPHAAMPGRAVSHLADLPGSTRHPATPPPFPLPFPSTGFVQPVFPTPPCLPACACAGDGATTKDDADQDQVCLAPTGGFRRVARR